MGKAAAAPGQLCGLCFSPRGPTLLRNHEPQGHLPTHSLFALLQLQLRLPLSPVVGQAQEIQR